jgi:hypothetical protein
MLDHLAAALSGPDALMWLAIVVFALCAGWLVGEAGGYARGVHETSAWVHDIRAAIDTAEAMRDD